MKRIKPTGIVLPIIFFVAVYLTGCTQNAAPTSRTSLDWLGTTITITVYDRVNSNTMDAVFSRIEDIHTKMSLQLPTSEISRINAAAGDSPVSVSPDTYYVIQRAMEIAEASQGAFDPTIGPLVSLWDITGTPYLPTQAELDELIPLVNYRLVELSPENRSVYLPLQGMKLDLGAIAKGYAADESASILRDAGVEHAILDLGGNIVVMGNKPDDSPWRVGIQNPFSPRGSHLAIYAAKNQTLVSSGMYERFFIQDGIRYHHILDPSTGFPAEAGIAGVTIISDSSILADALSTASFVLGVEKGMNLISRYPGVEAIFITYGQEIITSKSMNNQLNYTDEDFSNTTYSGTR
ncbi:FAD:protein FMN transferase [Spirochaeta lutea]|uniref:FAD:protein FMN transferase n=1 Tax=Spirochaeta lutea TaxID=1480694 RepID=A0A098QWX5_9SPIO|nr:FAD:protein FMN transferase [Spirochaeta lutea]KGE71898.1 hypothetical protein DC28_08775 [Spirochaeta lutea]